MDFKNRPKIKDLKRIYNCKYFYLHGDGILGNCVCINDDVPKVKKIVASLRRRGYLVIYESVENNGLWGFYRVLTKEGL